MCCDSMKRIVNRWSVYGDFATILYARSLERRSETKWGGGASNRSILFTMTKRGEILARLLRVASTVIRKAGQELIFGL